MAKRNRGTFRIDEEQLCADCFRRLLSTRLTGSSVEVLRTSEGQDPPDFSLSIHGVRFPVEVSSLVEKAVVNGRTVPILGIHAAFRKFARDVEKRASQSACLKGWYVITFGVQADVCTNREELLRSAIGFIRNTQTEDVTEQRKLSGGGHHRRINIHKLKPEGARVIPWYPGAKREDQIIAEVAKLIDERIATKRCKLERKSITAQDNPILILYDAYLYADIEDIRSAVASLNGEPWFHSVLCVRSKKESAQGPLEGECWVLFSAEPAWRDPGSSEV